MGCWDVGLWSGVVIGLAYLRGMGRCFVQAWRMCECCCVICSKSLW